MIETRSTGVLVIGAGPAGLAAGIAARASGAETIIVDDNPSPGGQIWRSDAAEPEKRPHPLLERVVDRGVDLLTETSIVAATDSRRLIAEQRGRRLELAFDRLVLAVGARERFIPFPGWTLPNVMGAGGLQALVKGGLPIEGKRVVVAGSGPLLLAVAAHLVGRGAKVEVIAEQAAFADVARFALGLVGQPTKLWQAIELRRVLRGVALAFGTWPIRAEGDDRLRAVVLSNGRRERTIECDYVACGFGLVPNLEIPRLLGCRTEGDRVAVDELQRTSIEYILACGEVCGIGGLETSLVEGEIAGLVAAGELERARSLFSRRRRARAFAASLDRAFRLDERLRSLPDPETIVCRCEDVAHDAIRRSSGILDAKLQTRCGMGPCQARICGPAVEFLFGWSTGTVRPPILPASIGVLAGDPTMERAGE
ncbi:MAG: FAD-dependent oxidoreductase [Isosphaeraceae bacterium]|nr:FAD-dependent oxidoreductase [Isosphaeraceae bacterium]